MDAELDLLPGQISFDITMPSNYVAPNGQFLGVGYNWESGTPEAIYEKVGSPQSMISPFNYRVTDDVRQEIADFIKESAKVFMVPQVYNKNTYIGIGHKLKPIEIANNMIAYRSSGYMDLDHPEVQRVIKNRFQELQGRGLLQKNNTFNRLLNTEIEVYDKDSSIYVCSFKYGVNRATIQKLLALDIQNAINVVEKNIKVPVSINQYMALVSLAFHVESKRLVNSKLFKKLNDSQYQLVGSHFLDFAYTETEYRKLPTQEAYDQRLREAELFSSF